MPGKEQVIEQTKNWIREVVIGCNFCPFAAREVKQNSIHYQVEESGRVDICLQALLSECARLDGDETIATTLLILPNGFGRLGNFLDLVAKAEKLLHRNGYEGIYQLASFQPLYQFAGASPDDAANYTNRSPYPMLHILREAAIDKALAGFPNPEGIPERNIRFAREKGAEYMKMLRESCL
ncbi:MAG TPA: DUF1415 domain-containing protein [Puia sp.]|jgi:hypothetical protein